ncbi:MAG: phosphonate ABC transporter ATP-binding protein [Bacteroidota bacterium]|nr:phosphonate ABC transporter ATP-binding protein [Bacteroidota bacterium]
MEKKQIILSVKDLEKTFENGYTALHKISFDIYEGEFLAIIGLSGSGKSTLLRCLNRLNVPTSGQIIFKGIDIAKVEGKKLREIRSKIGMIFQQFNIIPSYTVLINVLTGLLYKTNLFKGLFFLFSNEAKEKAKEAIKIVGLTDRITNKAGKLSGGQKQRVAIARALVQSPEILLADEPVASLDPSTSHTVMDYLKKINTEMGITVVCNLHFLSLVRAYATRVIAMKDGHIVFEGGPNEITDEWFKKIYGEEAKEVTIH